MTFNLEIHWGVELKLSYIIFLLDFNTSWLYGSIKGVWN